MKKCCLKMDPLGHAWQDVVAAATNCWKCERDRVCFCLKKMMTKKKGGLREGETEAMDRLKDPMLPQLLLPRLLLLLLLLLGKISRKQQQLGEEKDEQDHGVCFRGLWSVSKQIWGW